MRVFLTIFFAICALPVVAQDILSAELRPGWRTDDGRHIAALQLKLAPGWKTYWRAPGDAGIPPQFNWSGSQNVGGVALVWPAPIVFDDAGMRSVGYKGGLVLPLVVSPKARGDATLRAMIDLGVCEEICVPMTVEVSGKLRANATSVDPVIASALAARPFSATDAGVRAIKCSFHVVEDGLGMRAEIDMPSAGGRESVVIETGNAHVWVAEPQSQRDGRILSAQTRIVHSSGKPIALDRSAVTITVLGSAHAVEIKGCG